MISPEQSGDIKKNYCGHKIELFLDNLGNQELDNLRDHKQSDLLIKMAPTQKEFKNKMVERYVYSTAELYTKIKNIQQNMNISIYESKSEKLHPADFHQIAHFLLQKYDIKWICDVSV